MAFDLLEDARYIAFSQLYGWKSFFTYRLQAIVSILNNFTGVIVGILTVAVIYTASSGIAGWSYYQLLFLTLLSTLTFRLVSYFNIYALPRLLRSGSLDPYFTKPIGTLALFFSPPSYTLSPFPIITAGAFLAYVALKLGFTAASALAFAFLYILGLLALLFFLAIVAVLSYLLLRSSAFLQNAVNILSMVADYPLRIYGLIPQAIFSLLIPVGVAAYYPAEVFLGRLDIVSYVLLVLAALATILVSRYLVYRLMKRYSGGGG